MSVTQIELEEFHEFASRMITDEKSSYDLEELCLLWKLKHDSKEMESSLAALREGLEDIRQGRVYDADEVIAELRARIQSRTGA